MKYFDVTAAEYAVCDAAERKFLYRKQIECKSGPRVLTKDIEFI